MKCPRCNTHSSNAPTGPSSKPIVGFVDVPIQSTKAPNRGIADVVQLLNNVVDAFNMWVNDHSDEFNC